MKIYPENALELANSRVMGFNKILGIRYVEVTPEKVVAEMTIRAHHKQVYGLVHGGVYASMIETVCSLAGAFNVMAEGKTTVGVENTTAFLKGVRTGTLRCTATPYLIGRRTHVWEARVEDEKGRLAVTGRLRLLVMEPGASVAGNMLRLQTQQELEEGTPS